MVSIVTTLYLTCLISQQRGWKPGVASTEIILNFLSADGITTSITSHTN